MEQSTKIFGTRAVIEAINNDKTIEKVFLQKGLSGPLFSELHQLIRSNDITTSFVPVEKLNRLSKNGNHQGVVAQTSAITFANLEEIIEENISTQPLYLLLDRISDVRNFGAIIRTAECTGVTAIIIQKQGNAPINADTIKTSAGAAFNVPICKVSHIKDAIFQLQAADVNLIAATEKTEDLVYNVDFKGSTAIIMGAEDRGIHPSVLKMASQKAKLPLLGSISSLNVSVACGAFLYEAVRQRS